MPTLRGPGYWNHQDFKPAIKTMLNKVKETMLVINEKVSNLTRDTEN